MNYIWDAVIKAKSQGIDERDITFVPAESFSPYIELAMTDMNITSLEKNPVIEINAYYRFYEIFKMLLDINFEEYSELKKVFFNIIMHYLLYLDYFQGFNKREYYQKFILNDIKNNVFSQEINENISLFTQGEVTIILNSIIDLYSTNASLHLFKKILPKIFKNSIIYCRNEDKPEVLIYLDSIQTDVTVNKVNFLLALFLPLGFEYRIYWEKHFGIIGIDQTMGIENTVVY